MQTETVCYHNGWNNELVMSWSGAVQIQAVDEDQMCCQLRGSSLSPCATAKTNTQAHTYTHTQTNREGKEGERMGLNGQELEKLAQALLIHTIQDIFSYDNLFCCLHLLPIKYTLRHFITVNNLL